MRVVTEADLSMEVRVRHPELMLMLAAKDAEIRRLRDRCENLAVRIELVKTRARAGRRV